MERERENGRQGKKIKTKMIKKHDSKDILPW
jgi:vacuolar-type H+-ATPase subunit D/Vma8